MLGLYPKTGTLTGAYGSVLVSIDSAPSSPIPAMSIFPPPLKSAATNATAPPAVAKLTRAPNVPSPLPRRTVTSLEKDDRQETV